MSCAAVPTDAAATTTTTSTAMKLLTELKDCEKRVRALEVQARQLPLDHALVEDSEAPVLPPPDAPTQQQHQQHQLNPPPLPVVLSAAAAAAVSSSCPPSTPPLPPRPSSRSRVVGASSVLAGVPAVRRALEAAGVDSRSVVETVPSNVERRAGAAANRLVGGRTGAVKVGGTGTGGKASAKGAVVVLEAAQAPQTDGADLAAHIRELQLKVLRQEAMINALQTVVQAKPDRVAGAVGVGGVETAGAKSGGPSPLPFPPSVPTSSSSSSSSSSSFAAGAASSSSLPSALHPVPSSLPSLSASLSRVGLGLLGFEDLNSYISEGGVAIDALLTKVTQAPAPDAERIQRDLELARRHKAWRSGSSNSNDGDDEAKRNVDNNGEGGNDGGKKAASNNRSLDRSQILSNEDMGIEPPKPMMFRQSKAEEEPSQQQQQQRSVTFARQVVVNSGVTPSKIIVGRGGKEREEEEGEGERPVRGGNIAVSFGAGRWSRPATF